MSDPSQPVATLTQVDKTYYLDSVSVPVIRSVDILVRPAHFTVLLGPSGSGKTTLLNMIGCIDRPDSGEVIVAGTRVNELSDDALSDFRAKNIGFIFQNFNLLPVLSAYENIEYPLLLAGSSAKTRGERVPKLLEAVGLADKAKNLPGQLSGGQRQRVAIARALARKPKLVIADEPTANLDSQTGAAILSLMRHMQMRYRISFIFSSHDRAVIKAADDTIFLKDGTVRGIRRKPSEEAARTFDTTGSSFLPTDPADEVSP
ncbi:ABC transporter ATP-binding protein [soil metagenome]